MLLRRRHYLPVLLPIVRDQERRGWRHWAEKIEKEPQAFEVRQDGHVFQVEIQAFWDDRPQGSIRVLCSIDDGGWRAYMPVTEGLLIPPDAA